MAASYKPSPLSYGSPRASPFRRPNLNVAIAVETDDAYPLANQTMATATTLHD